jgi:hypothetical protein
MPWPKDGVQNFEVSCWPVLRQTVIWSLNFTSDYDTHALVHHSPLRSPPPYRTTLTFRLGGSPDSGEKIREELASCK